MRAAATKKPSIRIAVVESDPMRFVGFHALLDSEPDFELISASLPDIGAQQNIDLVLLGNHHGQNLLDVMSRLKAPRSQLRIIVTGSGMDEQTILTAMAAGAKGYVDAAASPADFVQAIRIVSRGSVWAPRRVLSMFIERISNAPRCIFPVDQLAFTDREKQVLKMLVEGRSNKEIGVPLGIGERTVKAHVAKLMRKVGVQNRVALTVHAITHSLVSPRTEGRDASRRSACPRSAIANRVFDVIRAGMKGQPESVGTTGIDLDDTRAGLQSKVDRQLANWLNLAEMSMLIHFGEGESWRKPAERIFEATESN